MQRLELFHAGRMDVAKCEHVFKSIFAPTFIAAASSEFLWIRKCSKKDVPQWKVGEIVRVMAKLVMNAMRFRSLKDVTEPERRADVPMIEKLSDCDKDGVIGRCSHTTAEKQIDD